MTLVMAICEPRLGLEVKAGAPIERAPLIQASLPPHFVIEQNSQVKTVGAVRPTASQGQFIDALTRN